MVRAKALCLLLGFATTVWADLTVRVVDPSGAAVPDATVVIRDASGNETASGITSLNGEVRLAGEPAEAEVRANGFQFSRVAVKGRSEVTVKLPLAPVEEDLQVTASVETVAPELSCVTFCCPSRA